MVFPLLAKLISLNEFTPTEDTYVSQMSFAAVTEVVNVPAVEMAI